MARHTSTHADEFFAGDGQAGGINSALRGIRFERVHRQVIEDAPAGDVDGIATSQAVAGAGNLTLDGAFVSGGVATIVAPRNIAAVSDNAGDTTQTLTITGTDIAGNPLVEDLALNGTTEVVTNSAFRTVTQIAIDAALAGNITAGTSVTLANIELGLDVRLLNAYDVLHALTGAGAADGGTFTVADQTSPPTASTGDARGTYNPGNAPDGSADFILYFIPDYGANGYGTNFSG